MRRALVIAALVLAGCAGPDTRFELAITPMPGDQIAARGTTSLPDGAQLNVTLEKAAGGDPLAVALPQVKGGAWSAMLDPKSDLPSGEYVVRAVFSPRAYAWSPAVKPAVGDHGEKLAGPTVKQGDGYRFLEVVTPVPLR